MRKIILISFLLLISSCNSQKKTSEVRNILFIGNSLTYFHKMPEMLQGMTNETNPEMNIEQISFPGMSLSSHLTNIIKSRTENGISTRMKYEGELTETEKKIVEKNWDVIILQTGTVAVLIPENRAFKTMKAIEQIKSMVTNPNCEFILFQTWPSKEAYPKKYCYSSRSIDKSLEKTESCSPTIENLKQEYELISDSYSILGKKLSLKISYNGEKFYQNLKNNPELELYEDDIHPNKNGAFLNACIFYEMLTNRDCRKLDYKRDLHQNISTTLKKLAHN
ncbi:DUF4886 domain-containing protein [Spongiivirga citrea]|uniref:DUF4886 domain-containing protein n=1 Tax=Spongiivirga citrea TaxID=1481457 RepID=A0A6M0CLQ3_9FLAO|nr:DUF4886 domain-containing protein [Spongiivirga citrea]NER18868.1 DUF4886 domain-containing protein [Spongiivirga citrea]